MQKYLHIIVPFIAVVLCSFFLLTSLDNKIYDMFLRTIPSLTEDESVLVVKIDDVSIENVGIFPWTRDIMADAIVFLREMKAESVIFDLNFIDKSPAKVDPAYVKEELPAYLEYGFNQINETVAQVMDAFASGYIGRSDAEEYKNQMIEFNRTVKDSMDASIAYVIRDVDAYFANTLKFFGDSYLTLTMILPEDIISDEKVFDMSPYDVEWLETEVALKNISGERDRKTPEVLGMLPAIPELLRKSAGAGFVNALPDADGYRRRQHLVYRYGSRYYGQLAFVPLLKALGNPMVEVTNTAITLRDAHVADSVRDIRLPRSRDGSILIKWPKKEFKDYNLMSAWNLIGYNRLEDIFVRNLTAMEESGFFSYWDGAEAPLAHYRNGQYIKELLFEGEDEAGGITMQTYRDYRETFYAEIDRFLNGPYEETILAGIGPDDTAVREYVQDYFSKTRAQLSELVQIRKATLARTEGAFCIVGVDATSMTDSGLTTFQERFPNVGIYAVMANMILSGEFLDAAPMIVSILIALVLSVGLGLFGKRASTAQSLIVGVATLFVSVIVLLLVFMLTRTYVGVIVPLTSAALTFLSLSAINFLKTIREKSFLRSAFSRYLSPAVISEIIADPSKLNLGGEKRELTAIFTDIKGFSTISESMDPADLVKLLNMYLTDMSNIILENRGTIDKYEGDAIIAFFGAPIHMEDHASLACRTAIRMKEAEARLNERIIAEKLSPATLFTRIGINTGDMIVGNMGTANKMDYTIMGNAVNLAARLEGVNKQYNTKGILISEHTRAKIGDDFLVRSLDRVRVVGVNTPLRLFELLAFKAEAGDSVRDNTAKWEEAITLYEKREFAKAREIFASISQADAEDKVAFLYTGRCDDFLKTPPPQNWDGVFNLTQK